MIKTITNIPIAYGLMLGFSKLPTVKGTIYGKVALAGVYTIDALGLVWIKNKLIDNTFKKIRV